MQVNFSPSTNIIRDASKEINYVATANSKEVFNQIISSYRDGNRVFNLIGSYGTGKSTFLWALYQDLTKGKNHFIKINGQFQGIKEFEFLQLIGDDKSYASALLESINAKSISNSHAQAIERLDAYYKKKCKNNKFLFIIVDEFGKFLEYAAKNNPEKELYFIQQLAEYVNDQNKNIILISTLHQGFSSYSKELTKEQRNEWEKVKGRIKEISFNEPVEQLIRLAANYITEKMKMSFDVSEERLKDLTRIIRNSNLVNVASIGEDIVEQILPLDLLSSSILVQSLQRYGQNERSLFSFLTSKDPYSLRSLGPLPNKFFHVESVYNYISHNFFSFINSKYNPDFSKWSAIKTSIEKIYGRFTDKVEERAQIIKVIGLINIFGSKAAKSDKSFLSNYLEKALGITNAVKLIKELEDKNFIRYAKYANQYILFDGTDLDIDLALIDADNRIDSTIGITEIINRQVQMPVLIAKRYMLETGTSRFFNFHISNEIIEEKTNKDYDGTINIVLGNKIKKSEIPNKEPLLYCNLTDIKQLRDSVNEIRKVEYVKKQNINDKVANIELDKIKNSEVNKIRKIILSDIYTNCAKWYYKRSTIIIRSSKNLNATISQVSSDVYSSTPIFFNELINKTKLSGAISLARRNLFKRLAENLDQVNLGFSEDKFPPEKTIYLTLLQQTGIHTNKKNKAVINDPNKTFKALWLASNDFISSASKSNKNIVEFIELLKSKPFGLKQGFIDFWVGIFLLLKADEYALYYKGVYVPSINADNLELVYKSPKDFIIKSYDLSDRDLLLFNKYRDLTNQDAVASAKNTTFIQTIRPFLILERSLPEVTKITKRFKDKRTLKLREAIINATDPEKLFFEDFPAAFSIFNLKELKDNDISVYISDLSSCIKELRTYYDDLVEITYLDIVKMLAGHYEFDKLKKSIHKRYKSIKAEVLPSHIKSFYYRVVSGIDDKESWVNSLVQDLVGITLERISDDDYDKLKNRLEKGFLELDHLVELHKVELEKNQEVYRIELTTSKGGDAPDQFIVNTNDDKKAEKLCIALMKEFSKAENEIKKLAIIKLLKKFTKHD